MTKILTLIQILETQKDDLKTKVHSFKISSVQQIKDSCYKFNPSCDNFKIFWIEKINKGKAVYSKCKNVLTLFNVCKKISDFS